jgi:GLPGLI family protein
MKKLLPLIVFTAVTAKTYAQQRTVAECTVTFGISTTSSDKDTKESLDKTSKTVYIKANQSRVDLSSTAFSQSVFFDKNTGNATILREIGGNKFISKMDNTKWKAANAKYEGAALTVSDQTKTILGYECKKATLKLTNGASYTLYFAANIIPSVKEFEYQFKDVPGFVLEYETEEDGKTITYTANKINLSPVPASKFDIPTSGYRVLNR